MLASDDVAEGMVVSCPECGASIECHQYARKVKLRKIRGRGEPEEDLPGSIRSKMASAIGVEKLEGFRLSELFAEAFSSHSREEVEECFTIGTAKSTPGILDVNASWPKPWLFLRMMLASLAVYFLFWAGWKQFANENFLPGLMMVGSFAVPVSMLVLFMELNVRRNISLYVALRFAFIGGILLLLITLGIGNLISCGLLPNSEILFLFGDSMAGPMEETAKVLAMVAVARASKYRYGLNGMLVGAAVGVGFSAFESMGYALNSFTDNTVAGLVAAAETSKSLEVIRAAGVTAGAGAMLDIVVVRGILSPFGHIVWSAIAGCALWRVIHGREFRWRMLCDERFIRLLLVPVLLHMAWNAPLQLPLYGKYLLVGVVGWFVCLSLVQEGLHEIAVEQTGARGQKEGHGTEEGTEDITKGGTQ